MPFKALGLHPALLQAIRKMNYAEPTPAQAEAIPAILAGRDLIATAQTGTGKTAAFLLPVLHQLLGLPRGTTRALVITPTRELAQQIDDVCAGLAYHTPPRVGLLVGGAAMGPQEQALRAGVALLIATPGRLLDHLRQRQARLDPLHTLGLDEADRTQPQRDRAMEGFRRGDYQVMVATNIAARGLDVTHITHVISFDVPSVPDDYVHRIGRTARAEAEGDAFVLVSPAEEQSLARIERQIGQRLPRVTLPDFDYSQRSEAKGPRAQDR